MTKANMVGAACLGACVTLVLVLSVDWKNAVSVERWIDQQSPYSSEHEPRIAEHSKTKTKPVARTPAKKDVSSGERLARTNFVFIKVHKAGSSTTTPIVARYALRQNLTVMFPLGRGTLSWPNIPRVNDYVHTPDEKYSVLFHHTVYNKEWMESKFPANTAYLAILREPFSHLKSSFNFYRLDRILPFKDRENPLKEFLRNPAKYPTSGVVQGILVDNTKNGQAFDMGYPVEKDRDMQYGREYIEQLDRDFTLILILEYLDLSLVMLKRLMCWETRDMLYIKRNSKTYPYKSYQPTEAERAAHRQWSPVEYAMYNHFNQTLWRKIDEQGPDFFKEMEFFRQVNKQVNDFCSYSKPQTGKDLPTEHIPESPWSDAFDITPHFCTLLGMDYGSIDSLIRTKQGRPILEKPCEQQKVKLKPNLYFALDGRPGFQTLEDVMKYNPKESKKPLNHEQSYILGRLTKSFQKCKKKQKGMKDHFHEVAGNFKVKVDKNIQEEMLNFLK